MCLHVDFVCDTPHLSLGGEAKNIETEVPQSKTCEVINEAWIQGARRPSKDFHHRLDYWFRDGRFFRFGSNAI